jgi:hypothetical protein
MAGVHHRVVLAFLLGLIMLPAGSGLPRTEAVQKLELSQDPLPGPGRLHAERIRLYGIGLGDAKRVVLQAAEARGVLVEDEPDVAFDVVYLYRDWIAVRTEMNLAAYRIRGGTVEAISLFGRLPRTTVTVPRFETLAPNPLRELMQACNDPVVRDRILGVADQTVTGGAPPERVETYRYDGGQIELEYTLFHFQHPRPTTSETCRLTFQRKAS